MIDRRSLLLGTAATLLSEPSFARTGERFEGVLILRPLDDPRLMQLQQPYAYVGADGHRWAVPANAIVDGASIPRVLWSAIGGPWDGRYRNASVIHDWFCAVRIMPWTATHRMFYEAMLTSGTDEQLAKIMFLAVRYCGPSWDDLTLQNSRLLTHNGTVRLDSPGGDPATNGWQSPAGQQEAKVEFLTKFDQLKEQVIRNDLSADQIEHLIDATGRREETAATLPM